MVCLIVTTVFCIVTIYSSYGSVCQNYPIIVEVMQGYRKIFGNPVLSFPAALFWIFMGKCFSENKVPTLPWSVNVSLLAFFAVMLHLEWQFVRQLDGSFNNDSYFLLLPVCILLFMCIHKIPPVSCPYAVCLRQASTVIYVTHIPTLYVISFIFRNILHIDSTLLIFILALVCCTVVYVVLKNVLRHCKNRTVANLLKYAY